MMKNVHFEMHPLLFQVSIYTARNKKTNYGDLNLHYKQHEKITCKIIIINIEKLCQGIIFFFHVHVVVPLPHSLFSPLYIEKKKKLNFQKEKIWNWVISLCKRFCNFGSFYSFFKIFYFSKHVHVLLILSITQFPID